MVQINRLRLSGFKSFVDKTELDIGGGLNGIVGPNGCGKSNLVEALRWVMGENRAKNMRSGDMEDVIFAGTAARPARSIAEVTVLLDNTDGKAPAPFGNSAQIEVTRRIERDKGSQYLVNGKQVRARDVQLLFADSLTGSHSPALVSQGRVTQLIQAKATERRQMLEESAGVASLYTRRHEAELRLKAADENLAKLDLVLGEMVTRANSLRNQARQALRYRDLSDTIRRFESLLAWQDWSNTREKLKKEEARFNETDLSVRATLTRTTELTVAVTNASEQVEIQRKTDIEARAELQILRQTSEQLERETLHRRNEYSDLNRQIAQSQSDLNLAAEQRDALTQRAEIIKADLERIASEDAGTPAEVSALEAEYKTAREQVGEAENAVLTLQDRIRRMISERDAANAALDRARSEQARAAARLAEIEAQYEAVAAPAPEEREMEDAQAAVAASKAARETAEAAVAGKQDALDQARERAAAAREALSAAQQDRDIKAREVKSLTNMLESLSKGFENSLILSLDIPADLTQAVATAAGDAALRAGEDAWNSTGEAFAASDWAAGVTPLSTLITAPARLSAFVSSVGIVDGDGSQVQLKRGQVIVNRDGGLWRWDGLAATGAKETREAQILNIRAQMRDAQAALETATPKVGEAEGAVAQANAVRDELTGALSAAQAEAKQAASQLYAAENRVASLQKAVNDHAARRTVLSEQRINAQTNAQNAEAALAEAQQRASAFESATAEDELRAELATAEAQLAERRAARDDISVRMESRKAAAAQVQHLRQSLEAEGTRTNDQITRGAAQAASLQTRISELEARIAALRPQIIADETGTAQQDLLDKINAMEDTVRDASDAFATADASAKQLASELRKVEEEGSNLREKRAVIQATVAALQAEQTRIATEIEDRFSTSPAALENTVMADWPDGLPSASKAKSERDFLNRERDAMGAVNLRAEIELTETESEHARLEAEKVDLTAAIERLREGIGTLNEEARERIVRTFDAVNAHFKELFTRLFGGGEAYLKLEGEDPLDAGLEIYAQPPGKMLQNLNLLSGGEQTLTALSMIFAMFLANPAPVCVLDEVDAPLDDANVDRVCGLLEQMSKSCATRFLVITHHRMTMARMDRLYGVTMAERGVSQLVSVNLAAQGDLLEQHKAA